MSKEASGENATLRRALSEARRREKLSQAEWRRRRAEVARLLAAGEDAAANAILAELGLPLQAVAPESATTKAATPEVSTRRRSDRSSVAPAEEGSPSGSARTKARNTAIAPAARPKVQRQPKPIAAKRPAATKPKPVAKSPSKPARHQQKRLKQLQRAAKRTWGEWFRSRPPWATSLAAHGVLLTLLGLLSFATLGDAGFSLSASLSEEDSWEDAPAEVELSELQAESDFVETADLTTELAEVDLAALVEPVSLTVPVESGDLLSLDAGSLMSPVPPAGGGAQEQGGGGGEEGEPKSEGGKVSFFGAESDAQRVVFVVDNSGSMKQGRMETTLLELRSAVRRLSQSQEFYVVFFSDQAYGMFFPDVAAEPVQATKENKDRLIKWLRSVEMCMGGRILDAVEIAAGMEPDVVFLLTDGDIRSNYVIERLTAKEAWSFPIHTFSLGARTPQHLALLQTIAENSGGTFRPVAPNPKAVAMSRGRPLPYHRTPGKVWGTAVQPWEN